MEKVITRDHENDTVLTVKGDHVKVSYTGYDPDFGTENIISERGAVMLLEEIKCYLDRTENGCKPDYKNWLSDFNNSTLYAAEGVIMEYLMENNIRWNGCHQIIWAVPMPIKRGERPCEIVIGKRNTDFEPYVAWHCFDGKSYAWGAYCSTREGAMANAVDKTRREMPFLTEEQAAKYCERYGKEL